MTTLSVRLDPEIEGLVARLAAQRGESKSEVIRQALVLLAKQSEKPSEDRPYDALAHLIGCVRGGPKELSTRTGERFQAALRKKQGGQ